MKNWGTVPQWVTIGFFILSTTIGLTLYFSKLETQLNVMTEKISGQDEEFKAYQIHLGEIRRLIENIDTRHRERMNHWEAKFDRHIENHN